MNERISRWSGWTAAAVLLTAAAAFADDRPNILFALADDWSYPHASIYGDKVVKTPTFDRVATEGVLFTHAYCATPSCTPSRGAILTGQWPHRLEEGGNLWSILPAKFAVYPDILEEAGYFVGITRKGWGPGSDKDGGRTRNPAGPRFKNFTQFYKQIPDGKPFCFWFGSTDPHRVYEKGSGVKSGMTLEDVQVPAWLPDTPEVRNDICDYYWEVQRFDREVGAILDFLDKAGQLENTLVVITSDNGMPFPRAKTNLYDSGCRMPMALRWGKKVKASQTIDDFVSFTDFAPTFLEAAGLKPTADMTGQSLMSLLKGEKQPGRDRVFFERERHASTRVGNRSYPARAIRTKDFLYIRNFRPKLWPAGDPELWHSVGPYGDIDGSPTKDLLLERRDDPEIAPFFKLAIAKRPAVELYDLSKDPNQLTNVADKAEYKAVKQNLNIELLSWMAKTMDPRSYVDDDRYDHYRYFGRGVKGSKLHKK